MPIRTSSRTRGNTLQRLLQKSFVCAGSRESGPAGACKRTVSGCVLRRVAGTADDLGG